ncbi:hypothetical protein DFR52_1011167 [Hoeflea marina]|uniref:Autotransporter domain-containing protein n=1 Tax=Hoeflea marina TaxID=274592 RepID=A0A317PSL7_9HYPH|nr:hypothetical protein [Hoeflea marina]PWW04468.1 hypothetical protein DFR52_1011167 [Hoeflea marina]
MTQRENREDGRNAAGKSSRVRNVRGALFASSALTLLALAVSASPALAQSTWNGSVDSDWTADANWTPAAPGPGDLAVVSDGGAPSQPVVTGIETVDTLDLSAGSVTIDTGGELTAVSAFDLSGGTLNGPGTLATSTTTMTGGLIAGDAVVDTLTFAQTGGINLGTVTADFAVVAIGGAVTSIGANGITASNASASGITVTTSASGQIVKAGSGNGITLDNSTGGDVLVTLGADIEVANGDAINVVSTGGGTVTITGTANLVGGTSDGQDGIDITSDGDTFVSLNGDINGDPGVVFNSAAGADFTLTGSGNVTGGAGEGVFANTTGGDGNVLINRDGAILGDTTGVDARSSDGGTGTGTVTVTSFAGQSITGTNAAGVITRTDLGQNTVDGAGSISGVTFGVDAQSIGGGVTVSGTGTTTSSGAGSTTINAQITGVGAETADLLVDRSGLISNTGAGSTIGINATSNLTGSGDVTVTGAPTINIAGTGSTAIYVGLNVLGATGVVTVDAGVITSTGTGNSGGINAFTSSPGLLDVDSAGVTLSAVSSGIGIRAYSAGNGNITVDTSGVINGGGTGIFAQASGVGTATVTLGADVGDITAPSAAGVEVSTQSGLATVDGSGNVNGTTRGIDAQSLGGGVTVSGTGATTSTGAASIAINAQQTGAGAESTNILVSRSGTVTNTGSGGTIGINATSNLSGSGDVTVTGISAVNIAGNGSTGIVATISNAAASGAVVVNSGLVTSTGTGASGGIRATNLGSGAVDIDSAGVSLLGVSVGTGIFASSATGALTVDTSGTINGGNVGIDAASSGANVTVTTAAAIGDTIAPSDVGISATVATSTARVTNNAAVTSGTNGITATATAAGNVTVDGSGSVTGTAGYGISATSAGGNVLVDKSIAGGTVSGASDGIIAITTGTGTATVTVANNVTGTSNDGIRLGSGTGWVTLNINGSGTVVTGGANAVNVTGGSLANTSANLGTISSAANAFNFSGAGTGVFTNANLAFGDIQTAAGVTSFQLVNSATGAWTLNAGNTSTFAGTADRLTNNGIFNVSNNLVTGIEFLTNTGTISSVGASTITMAGAAPVLDNTGGVITSTGNSATGDVLTVNGDLDNGAGGTFNLDVELTNVSVSKSDRVIVNGALTGTINVNFNETVPSTLNTPGDTTVISATDNSGSTLGSFTGLTNGPLVQYDFLDSGNDYVIRTSLNLGTLGGLVGSLATVQNVVNSSVNRPSSAFVSRPDGVDPDTCAPGVYSRLIGGTSTASATTSSPGSTSAATEVEVNYGGLQAGVDWGCFNIGGNGGAVNVGLLGGVNLGTASQNQASIVSDNRFTSTYGGVYATYSRDRFFADIQTVFDWTSYRLDSRVDGDVFVADDDFDTRRFTISGSMGYAFSFDEVSLVPAVGFNYSRTSADSIAIDAAPGGSLQFEDVENMIGFASLTLARSHILANGTSTLRPFVTATVYNDFASDPVVNYISPSLVVTPTSTTNFGTYGELSAGLTYRSILQAGDGGLRELSAGLRGDVSFNENLLGGRVTANLRLQF